MLGLQLPTDPRWVDIVEENIHEILTDHAFCEQKAASYAISIVCKYPELPELVAAMIDLAKEELDHFNMVHQKVLDRGWTLGYEKRDFYVKELMSFMKKGGSYEMILVDRLLTAAMIEARSCERFRMLSEKLKDEDLSNFYRDLMASEARHYTMFLGFAKKYGKGVDVDKRWKEFLAHEATVIGNFGNKDSVHG